MNKVVIIDDPISSLDEHRAFTTMQEIRRLFEQVGQVIVLSHQQAFSVLAVAGSPVFRACERLSNWFVTG